MNNISTEGHPGRAPFFWINWPCSDNSKQHLIMGGNDTFLHPGVDPSKIDGIVLNPMQQAEANKSALFAIADILGIYGTIKKKPMKTGMTHLSIWIMELLRKQILHLL